MAIFVKKYGLYLESLTLVQFKNYANQQIECSPRLNCFVGLNGMGKTNLLDAVYYLCMGKSYFNLTDQFLVLHGADFFRLVGQFQREGKAERVVIKVQPRRRKEIEWMGQVYDRLSDHVGRFPVVIIVPDDTRLITEGSEDRRRFVDNTLCQLDAQYLRQLIQYNHLLRQRNALLKQTEGRENGTRSLLLVYDRQLAGPAHYIYTARENFLRDFAPRLEEAYRAIAGEQESIGIQYRSHLAEASMEELLTARMEKDLILQRTTGGIHRDDLLFTFGEHTLKRVASQGQLKSFVLALKLSQYQVLKADKGEPPILLLDDIFDKLDPQRVRQLLGLILQDDYGQVFLSDTDPERVRQLLEAYPADHRLFHIENGQADTYVAGK